MLPNSPLRILNGDLKLEAGGATSFARNFALIMLMSAALSSSANSWNCFVPDLCASVHFEDTGIMKVSMTAAFNALLDCAFEKLNLMHTSRRAAPFDALPETALTLLS